MQKSYFELTLEKSICRTEDLLRKLQAVQTDCADKRIEDALKKSVAAAKLSEDEYRGKTVEGSAPLLLPSKRTEAGKWV